MSYIEKITICNARRFGKTSEIDFGKGATIILAPNGTGKTTIFEAIELALTGTIKRLENSIDAIIQDGQAEMEVRLDFENGKYCSASYKNDRKLERICNFNELFDVPDISSIPYLFRLTHYLEQSGKDRFFELDEKAAGERLGQLHIGKDLNLILSKRNSLIRSLSKNEGNLKIELNNVKKELNDFNLLIEKKNEIGTINSLVSFEEIKNGLIALSNNEFSFSVISENDILSIFSQIEKFRMIIKQRKENTEHLLVKYGELKDRIVQYGENLIQIGIVQNRVKLSLENKVELDKEYLLISNNIQSNNEKLAEIEDVLKVLQRTILYFDEIDKKTLALESKKQELVENQKELNNRQLTFEQLQDGIMKLQRLLDLHKDADDRIETEKKKIGELNYKNLLLVEWQSIKVEKSKLNSAVQVLESYKIDVLSRLNNVEKDLLEAAKRHSIKRETLESLNEASNAILNSISNIRKNIQLDQRNCPLCQAEYEHNVLIERIENSLNVLNPSVSIAIVEEKEASEFLKAIGSKHIEIKQEYINIESKWIEAKTLFDDKHKKLMDIVSTNFAGNDNYQDVKGSVEELLLCSQSKLQELLDLKSKLELLPDIQMISSEKMKKSEEERAISDLRSRIDYLRNELIKAEDEIGDLSKQISNTKRDSASENIIIELSKRSLLLESNDAFDSDKRQINTKISNITNALINEKEELSILNSKNEGICMEWMQAKLDGQPNADILFSKKTEAEDNKRKFDEEITQINNIEQDLSTWRAAEKSKEIDNEIMSITGDGGATQYLEDLKSKVEKKELEVAEFTKKQSAINSLLDNVLKESDKVHEQLNEINEPWKKLLSRIIISPLISAAPLLNNSNLRNQPIAKTSALIHNKFFDISRVASEAQLSDLQLTLMLSMARKYQWTSLKSLLLDDPTKHHDLVHASSVFDVLRDYILDYDYQVLMSTHDSTQARFFQRKLENEGVESKIYQLISRSGGVAAERIL